MAKKLGLGRNLSDLGLNELLSDMSALNTLGRDSQAKLHKLPIDVLRPGKYQPRGGMNQESLAELATSIRSQGIIQPLIVRSVAHGEYEIIAGERRWRAAQLAGLQDVPVLVREVSDNEAIAYSLIENVQREDLNPIDVALALKRLIDEFAITHEAAADIIGKSRVTITNLLRLLSLHAEVRAMLQNGELEMGHARALLSLSLAEQLNLAKTIARKHLSVRAVEAMVQNLGKTQGESEKNRVLKIDPNIAYLQRQLAAKIGANVSIQHTKSGKGRVIVYYNSLDELEGVLEHFNEK